MFVADIKILKKHVYNLTNVSTFIAETGAVILCITLLQYCNYSMSCFFSYIVLLKVRVL